MFSVLRGARASKPHLLPACLQPPWGGAENQTALIAEGLARAATEIRTHRIDGL